MRSAAGLWGAGVVLALLLVVGLTQDTAAQPGRHSYITVVVRNGQTLWSISRAYGVSVDVLVRLNGLRSPDAIQIGQHLRIPVRGAPKIRQTPRPSSNVPRIVIRDQFMWPARGMLTSTYGWRRRRHHSGIDIAAPWGSPIVAARDGTVIYAGWYHAYGRTVILDHGNGIMTLYGHASTMLVRQGQQVGAGQVIARIGCTGRCTGPHVHFEIRVNGHALNPLTASLVESLPPAPKVAAQPIQPKAAASTASVETVVHRKMVAQGPDGEITKTIEETLRNGQVVRRVEETTTIESGKVVRTRTTYELVDGSLRVVDESRQTVEDVKRGE